MPEHIRGCAVLQGISIDCTCNLGTIDGIAGDARCTMCRLDNRNGTHQALEQCGHLSHEYTP